MLPLYLTGFVMYHEFMQAAGGFSALIATPFGKLLTLKLAVALGLLAIFLSAPFVFMRRQPNPLKYFFVITGDWRDFRIGRFEVVHYLALAFGLTLVVLGKLLWMD